MTNLVVIGWLVKFSIKVGRIEHESIGWGVWWMYMGKTHLRSNGAGKMVLKVQWKYSSWIGGRKVSNQCLIARRAPIKHGDFVQGNYQVSKYFWDAQIKFLAILWLICHHSIPSFLLEMQ
jgi:hypothetical protein